MRAGEILRYNIRAFETQTPPVVMECLIVSTEDVVDRTSSPRVVCRFLHPRSSVSARSLRRCLLAADAYNTYGHLVVPSTFNTPCRLSVVPASTTSSNPTRSSDTASLPLIGLSDDQSVNQLFAAPAVIAFLTDITPRFRRNFPPACARPTDAVSPAASPPAGPLIPVAAPARQAFPSTPAFINVF